MLETDAAPVDAIGREVGYEHAASFRRLTKLPARPQDLERSCRRTARRLKAALRS